MAYEGYLLKMGGGSGEVFPESLMYKDSYNARLEAQDLDSTRNANGKLERNVLDHVPAVLSFTIKPCRLADFNKAMGYIQRHYTTSVNNEGIYPERKLSIKFFCPEYGKYLTKTFYLSTPEPTIMQTYHNPNDIRYDATTLEFISY